MPKETNDQFDLDKILDKAAEEDQEKTEIEKLEAEKKELAEKVKSFEEAEKEEQEKLSKEEQEKLAKQKEDEDVELDPVLKEMKDKIEAQEQRELQDEIARVTEGMEMMEEEFPELMDEKELLAEPVVPGADTSGLDYIKVLLSKGQIKTAKKLATTMMKANGIKSKRSSEALPNGHNSGGTKDTDSEEVKKRQKHINGMFQSMYDGKLARRIAAEKNSATT